MHNLPRRTGTCYRWANARLSLLPTIAARLPQWTRIVVVLGCLCMIGLLPAAAQRDTSAVPSEAPVPDDHSPHGALWRAAAIPGWGQLYNQQYLKIPAVYLGFGGLTSAALYMNDRYLLYRHAFLYSVKPDEYPQYADEAARFQRIIDAGQGHLLRQERDKFRRNRDLLYISIGLWYGLTVLDAYISAHLLDFDVSEDLTVSIYPHPRGLSARLRITP